MRKISSKCFLYYYFYVSLQKIIFNKMFFQEHYCKNRQAQVFSGESPSTKEKKHLC